MTRIIYTPETDHFRLGNIEMIGNKQPGDPATQKLRENYKRLSQAVPLPLEVGVVSYEDLFKRYSKRWLAEIEKPQTTYQPLEIMRQIIALKGKDTDLLGENYVYRMMTALLCHHSIGLDDILMRNLLFAPNIPHVKRVNQAISELKDKIRKEGLDKNPKIASYVNNMEKNVEGLREVCPSFDDLEREYKKCQRKFEANRVSAGLPLYFMRPKYFPVSLFSVSLVDEIETPEWTKVFLKLLEAGCSAQGMAEIPEEIKKQALIGQRDKFGVTKRVGWGNIEELLATLPEPKTIITDVYIVDYFPWLADRGFEPVEFKL